VVVRIGVVFSSKEIEVEMAEDTEHEQVVRDVEAALGDGGGVLWLVDRRGRRVGVPADKMAYIELGAEAGERRVGFAAR
jgi:hypothetical protein